MGREARVTLRTTASALSRGNEIQKVQYLPVAVPGALMLARMANPDWRTGEGNCCTVNGMGNMP